MRLRSSQFVFLLLLICSVQAREECAWHLRDAVSPSRTAASSPQRDATSTTTRQLTLLHLRLERLTPTTRLSSEAIELRRTVWTMRTPAQDATATASHTSFLRA